MPALAAAVATLAVPAAAVADPTGRPKPAQPVSPPGYVVSGADRPVEANSPMTGGVNRYEHENRP